MSGSEERCRRLLARLVAVVDEMLLDVEEQTVAASRAGTLRPSGCEGCGAAPGTVGTNGAGALCRPCWQRWIEHPEVRPGLALVEEGDGAS